MGFNVPLHIRANPFYQREPHGFRWVRRTLDGLWLTIVLSICVGVGALAASIIQMQP